MGEQRGLEDSGRFSKMWGRIETIRTRHTGESKKIAHFFPCPGPDGNCSEMIGPIYLIELVVLRVLHGGSWHTKFQVILTIGSQVVDIGIWSWGGVCNFF